MTRDEAAIKVLEALQRVEDALRTLGVDGRYAIAQFPGVLAIVFTPEAAAAFSMMGFIVDIAPPEGVEA